MVEIESTIDSIERLYRSITGQDPPANETPYAPIPPEKNAVAYVEDQLERLGEALSGTAGTGTGKSVAGVPPLSIWDAPQALFLCLDMPGVSRSTIEVSVAQNVLSVSGVRESTPGNGAGECHLRRSEVPMGTLRRWILLPPGCRQAEITARFRDGILELHIPRGDTPGEGRRTVPIQLQ